MKRDLFVFIFGCCSAWGFDAAAQIDTLKAGDQTVISGMTGRQAFAGSALDLSGFSGVFGMSSDTAYVVTAAGEVRLGRLKAKPGEVLILTPYGGKPVKQFFDAERFLAASATEQSGSEQTPMTPELLASFEKIKRKQKRAKFFGLLQPTNFNVAAPGSKEGELARRSIVGSDVIQNIRFSNLTDPEAVEREIINAFRDALLQGNAEAVASLMDPTPYGGSDMRGGANGARLLMAKRLIASKNWNQLLQSDTVERVSDNGLWIISSDQNRVNIRMRPIGDFTYISSIEQGA